MKLYAHLNKTSVKDYHAINKFLEVEIIALTIKEHIEKDINKHTS